MLVRVVRAVLGTTLLLVGLPLLLAGGGLWFAVQHQDPAGGYSARLSTIVASGHAVVASDVDALLRREAPFARGGRTTLRLTAQTPDGPAFVGLAPARDVARYLAGVPYQRVEEVRLARGALPVVTSPVEGVTEPATPPGQQPFWVLSSSGGLLEWSPQELRDQQLAVVVMAPDGSAPLTVDMTTRVHLRWLDSTTYALLVLGTLLPIAAVILLAWPGASREVVYVVPPGQVPEVAARLGIPLPREDAGQPQVTTSAVPPPGSTWLVEPPAPPAAAPAVPPGEAAVPPGEPAVPPALPTLAGPPAVPAGELPTLVSAPSAAGPRSPGGMSLADLPPLADPFEWPPPAARHATATPTSAPPAARQ